MEKIDYFLLKDINWFGKQIPAGTIYKQVNADYWHPVINKARCPSMAIDFMTVRNNPDYFISIKP